MPFWQPQVAASARGALTPCPPDGLPCATRTHHPARPPMLGGHLALGGQLTHPFPLPTLLWRPDAVSRMANRKNEAAQMREGAIHFLRTMPTVMQCPQVVRTNPVRCKDFSLAVFTRPTQNPPRFEFTFSCPGSWQHPPTARVHDTSPKRPSPLHSISCSTRAMRRCIAPGWITDAAARTGRRPTRHGVYAPRRGPIPCW